MFRGGQSRAGTELNTCPPPMPTPASPVYRLVVARCLEISNQSHRGRNQKWKGRREGGGTSRVLIFEPVSIVLIIFLYHNIYCCVTNHSEIKCLKKQPHINAHGSLGQLGNSADLSQAWLISFGCTHVPASPSGSEWWPTLDDFGWPHLHVWCCQAVSWQGGGYVPSSSRLAGFVHMIATAGFQESG